MSVSSLVDARNAVQQGLTIDFKDKTSVIDPTIICTSTALCPLGVTCERHVFWYDGYYWLFYNSGNALCYRYSVDGASWSSPMTVYQSTTPWNDFEVVCWNGEVAIGWYDTTWKFWVERGDILNNNITWSGAINLLPSLPAHSVLFGSVSIDNNGDFWAALMYTSSGDKVTAFASANGRTYASYTYSVSVPFQYQGGTAYAVEIVPTISSTVDFLVVTDYQGDQYGSYMDISSANCATDQTSGLKEFDLNLDPNDMHKENDFSAVASPDGALQIAYQRREQFGLLC